MKFICTAAILLFVVTFASNLYGFDCQRKGVVLGFGAGYAPLLTGEWGNPARDYDNKHGIAVIGQIGYSWNNQDQVLWLINPGGYYDTVDVYCGGTLVHENEISFTQGFSGVVYRHYFSPQSRSFFVTGGVGAEIWVANEKFNCHRGLGFLFGVGYEFTGHLQIEGNFSFGYTSSCRDIDYNHSQLVFTIAGVLY